MRRKDPIDRQVYNYLYPWPQKADPPSFIEFVRKCLVPEIRYEVHQFYGVESRTLEGKYPGLDYNSPYHRMRLRRYSSHRKLFKAFDALNLTHWEIYYLCDWEGTLLVKGRYEQQQGVTLVDTTGNEIAVDMATLRPAVPMREQWAALAEREAIVEHGKDDEAEEDADEEDEDEGDGEVEVEDDDDDDEIIGDEDMSDDDVVDIAAGLRRSYAVEHQVDRPMAPTIQVVASATRQQQPQSRLRMVMDGHGPGPGSASSTPIARAAA